MDIEKVPGLKNEKWPRKITFAVDEETYQKVQFLKYKLNKSPSALGRMLLDEFFEQNAEVFSTMDSEGLPSGN